MSTRLAASARPSVRTRLERASDVRTGSNPQKCPDVVPDRLFRSVWCASKCAPTLAATPLAAVLRARFERALTDQRVLGPDQKEVWKRLGLFFENLHKSGRAASGQRRPGPFLCFW